MSTSKNRTWIFEEAPIGKAVWTMALPTVITQLINIIYNYADTWYVGRTGNPAMVAAMSVSMPLFILLAAIANLFGIGGSSVISRSLGMKKPQRARHTFAFCFWCGMGAALVYVGLFMLIRNRLLYAVGADADTFAYTWEYTKWTIIIGAIPTVGNVLCGHLVRSIGASKEAGFGMSMGGVLNMILDPLFMFVILPKGQEVVGAAIATMLSNTAAFMYFLVYLYKHRDNPVFTMHPGDFSAKEGIPGDVLLVGFPAALATGLAMVSNIFANKLVSGYGSAAVAGMGVAKKVNMISFNTCMGLTQGVLPLLGFTYGAKNYDRMRRVIRYTLKVVLIFGAVCTTAFFVFAPAFVSFFIGEEQSVAYGSRFLRVICFACILSTVCYMANAVFQAAGRKTESLVLSIVRKGVLDVVLMIVLHRTMGIMGVVIATPITEICGVILAGWMYLRFRGKYLCGN